MKGRKKTLIFAEGLSKSDESSRVDDKKPSTPGRVT